MNNMSPRTSRTAMAGVTLAHAGLPGLLLLAPDAPEPVTPADADGNLAYKHVAQIMADAARAGLTRLGFVTDPRAVQ